MSHGTADSADRRGCNSNGRALALHTGDTGIDILLLHTFVLPTRFEYSPQETLEQLVNRTQVCGGG